MITGLRPNTAQELQLNAGMFVKDFDYSSYASADDLETALIALLTSEVGILGATRGGGSFECRPTMRDITADGKRGPVKGMTVVDEWLVKLKTTLLETNAQNWADALMCVDSTTVGRVTTMRVRNELSLTDYIDNLIGIGDTSQGLVLIDLENALNVAGAMFTFTDRGEGAMPVEFQAHQNDLTELEYAPCSIIFFDDITVASHIDVYSVEGTLSGDTLITNTPQASGTQSYFYKTAAAVALPSTGDILVDETNGWYDWDGAADITATDGHQIVIAICTTATGAVVAAGRTTVVAKA